MTNKIDDEHLEFEDFLVKFNEAFPLFALSPDEIFKFWSKNERKRLEYLSSLTPDQDKRLDACIDKLKEVMNE